MAKKTSTKAALEARTEEKAPRLPIIFDSAMRKALVENVVQDLKGRFEYMTDGKVSISYDEDTALPNFEFAFKITASKEKTCSKQMWSEATSAIVNAVNYMFPASSGDDTSIDVIVCAENGKLEIDIVSMW